MYFRKSLIFLTMMALLLTLTSCTTVVPDSYENGQAVFKYSDKDIQVTLSEEELAMVCDMFAGKELYMGNPSCGFTEDVAIKLDNKDTFCIACDKCGIVFWKEQLRYFRLTDSENEQLRAMLESHGFRFPCI
ncbi:MAG: hypothetical protein IJB27_04105 [Clostridia bacterium]|nr:hypothetical protein [Clostridia bacterium]